MSEAESRAMVTVEAALMLGQDEEIKNMANAIKLRLPGGDKLSVPEAFALATVSIGYGLNPFNGECWYIPGSGPMVGIKGLRKAARYEVKKQGGNYWVDFQLIRESEKKDLQIPQDSIAYKALLYRTDLVSLAADAISKMGKAGLPWEMCEQYLYRPAMGIGYWRQGEKTKMKPDQCARKRAEAEALKVAFDMPFGFQVGNGTPAVGVVDREAVDLEDDGDFIDVDPETGEIINPEGGEVPLYSREMKEAREELEAKAAAQEAAEDAEDAPSFDGDPPPIVDDDGPPEGAPSETEDSHTDGTGRARWPIETIRSAVRKKAGWAKEGDKLVRRKDGEPINPTMAGRIASILGRAVAREKSDERRLARIQVLQYLFGEEVESTNNLYLAEGQAVLDWCLAKGGAYTQMQPGVREEAFEMVKVVSGQDTLPGF